MNPKAQYKLLLNELKGQIKLYGKMDKERLRDTIRDNLGRAINTHLYTKIRGYKSRTVILPDDVIAAPINIKEIKGLGVGKCLEYAILTQNIFSFLGFNMYMVTGQLSINDDDFDWHSWNVLEQNGTYLMIDVINGLVDGQLSNIKNKYDLLKFGERTYKNPMGVKLKYKSYMERERTLEDLAAKGKIFRAQASNYLNGRLAMYEYLRQKK